MTGLEPRELFNSIRYKSLTMFWFGFRQLMFSKLNLGIIVLVIIPLILSGMYATDLFMNLEDEDRLYGEDDPIYDVTKDDFYLDDEFARGRVRTSQKIMVKNNDENYFEVDLHGTTTDNIVYMDFNVVFYYKFELDDILSQAEPFMDDISTISDTVSGGSIPDIIDSMGDGDNNFTESDRSVFTVWDFNASESDAWSNGIFRFTAELDIFTLDINYIQFPVRLNRDNALPFINDTLDDNSSFILQIGTLNFSQSGQNWEGWNLHLEFGEMDFLISQNFSSELLNFYNEDAIRGIEESKLLWPDQIVIFVNGYDNSSGVLIKSAQDIYTRNVKNPPDDPGHLIFIDAGGVLYFRFIIPIIVLLYTITAIAEDREIRTVTYLISRPISKTNLLVTKYLSAVFASSMVIIPSLILTFLIMSGYKDGLQSAYDNIEVLGVFVGLTAFAIFVYAAIFTLISNIFRQSLFFGLIYLFFFDELMVLLPFSISRISIIYHLTVIESHKLASFKDIAVWNPLEAWLSVTILLITAIAVFVVAVILHKDKDFH